MDDFQNKELFGPAPGKEGKKKYADAFNQAKREFAEQGIEFPTGQTPGFLERVQNIYKNLMGDAYQLTYSIPSPSPAPPTTGDVIIRTDQEVKEILRKGAQMDKEAAIKPLPGKTYGGYAFSLAQLETVAGLPDETLTVIGETMVKALSAGKRKYLIKEELWDTLRLNWDTEFFVELAFANSYFLEKPIITAAFHEWGMDAETEEELHEILDESAFLKHYPELKAEILENILLNKEESRKESENYICIRKGKKLRIIEKGTKIPDGWTVAEGVDD